MKTKITKKELVGIYSGAHRQLLIELGMYVIPANKVHKDKSKYNRKLNQNTRWREDV